MRYFTNQSSSTRDFISSKFLERPDTNNANAQNNVDNEDKNHKNNIQNDKNNVQDAVQHTTTITLKEENGSEVIVDGPLDNGKYKHTEEISLDKPLEETNLVNSVEIDFTTKDKDSTKIESILSLTLAESGIQLLVSEDDPTKVKKYLVQFSDANGKPIKLEFSKSEITNKDNSKYTLKTPTAIGIIEVLNNSSN